MEYINNNNNYKIIWKQEHDYAIILRMYGENSEITIPEFIDSIPVKVIGDYCFSSSKRFESKNTFESYIPSHNKTNDNIFNHLTELCGDNINSISLPNSITQIGNYAFYNCKNLSTLELGCNTTSLGSDIFMNCHKLHKLTIRCGINEQSGARALLRHLSSGITIHFTGNNKSLNSPTNTEALLFFPEYFETYEEIAPAHIFGLNVTGEGFRARQCFTNDIVNLSQYDAIFSKASCEETESTLNKMALYRLFFSYGLTDDAKKNYEKYICNHSLALGLELLNKDMPEFLEFICLSNYVNRNSFDAFIQYATYNDKAKYTASLIKWKCMIFPDSNLKKTYSFDDF